VKQRLTVILPCEACSKFDKERGYCSKANDYLFNVYAKLFWSCKRGEDDSAKVKEANI